MLIPYCPYRSYLHCLSLPCLLECPSIITAACSLERWRLLLFGALLLHVCCVLGRSSDKSIAALLPEAAKLVGVATSDDQGASNGVADNDRDDVSEQDITNGQRDPEQQSGRYDEKVGDGMLEANSHKRGDWEPDADKLSSEVVGGAGKKDSETHHPITQDGLDNGLTNGCATLV